MDTAKLTAAAATCHSIDQLNGLAREGWQQWAEGAFSDDDAERLQSLVSERKESLRTKVSLSPGHRPTAARRHPSQRIKSIFRRRRLATSGVVPGTIASNFTMGEIACLSVIAQEAKRQRRNQCEFPVEKIAGLAGVCATVVRTALREARHLGLVVVTERRRAGQRSLTNIIDIVGPEWRLWLKLGKLGGVGALLRTPRITREIKTGRSSFVHVGAEERYSQPDKPGRRSAELARFEQEIGSTPSKGIGTRNANRC